MAPDTVVATGDSTLWPRPAACVTMDTVQVAVAPAKFICREVVTEGPATPPPDASRQPRRVPSHRFSPRRMAIVAGGFAVADAALMTALYDLWYTEKIDWHWYSDAPPDVGVPDDGWLDDWNTYAHMDKGGHVIAPFHMAQGLARLGRWTGLSQRGSAVFGGALAFAFMGQIEWLDGYDRWYGASRTDLIANGVGALGGALSYGLTGEREPVTLKVSYHRSPYYDAAASYAGNAIKDYDGLSYWLVARPAALGAPQWWPRWLGATVGYGADGLAHPGSGVNAGATGPGPVHRKEFYLGLDLDVLHAERHRLPRALRPVASALSFIRLPMPALQFGPAGTRWHWLYY